MAPTALALLSLPFLRPNLFGEALSPVGFVILCAAAGLALLPTGRDPGAFGRSPEAAGSTVFVPLVVCLGSAYLWLMIQAAALDPGDRFRPAFQGFVLTVGAVGAFAMVCQDPRTRFRVARGFVLLIVSLCVSYVVTAGLWVVLGIGSGQIGTLSIDGAAQPLYFPFTPSQGVQSIFGVEYPRFTGLGREPGWMAMYCAAAYFMVDAVGFRRRVVKLLLVIGLLGAISTAGFGVFVVVWAYRTFMRDRGTGIRLSHYLRQLAALGAIALAVWVAAEAPVVGLSAKTTQNETSLEERVLATEAGLRALFENPLGGAATEAQAGINLIAEIPAEGLPFVVFVCGALLLPLLASGRAPAGRAVGLTVFLTLLMAQPPKDSTWAFCLLGMACALTASDVAATKSTTLGEDREHS